MNRLSLTMAPVFSPWIILLLLVLGAAATAALYRLNREKIGKKRSLILSLLRLMAVLLILVCALNPGRVVQKVHTVPPSVAVLVDMSETMGQPLPGEKGTRLEQAAEMLTDENNSLFEVLQQHFRVDVYGLSDSVKPLTVDEISRLSAGGRQMDLDRAFKTLGDSHAAIVMLSDGNVTWRNDTAPTVPVISVPLGDPAVFKDILLHEVKAPSLGFRGREVVIDARVKSYGYPNVTLPVMLKDAGRLLTAGDVHFEAPSAEKRISLAFVPDTVGRKKLTVEIPRQAGENLTGNNLMELSINILRDKIRILMISGTPSMNYRYMRTAFKSDPSIDLLSFVILRTPSDILNVPTHEQSLIPFPVETLFTRELDSFDLVIFDNFNYSLFLRPEYLENLQNYVKNGGAFAMIGGPNLFNEGRDGLTPISDILPVQFGGEKMYRRDFPVSVRLSRSGSRHPIMQIRDDLAGEDAGQELLWQEMPQLDGINPVDAKRSARVLIESADAIPWPILTVSSHGKGRVLALATDYAWKWYMGMVAAERWSQAYLKLIHRMVRWLTKDPGLDPVQMTLPQTETLVGREVDVRISLEIDDPSVAPEAAVLASVYGPAGNKIASKLKSLSASKEYLLSFTAEKAGAYRIEAETPAGRQEDFLIVAGLQERLDAAPRHDVLEKIADATGGKMVSTKEQLASVIGDVARKTAGRFIEEKRVPLWATSYVMAAIIGILSLEWFFRRRWGLL